MDNVRNIDMEKNDKPTYNLLASEELRVIASDLSQDITVKLLDGTAEIFGAPMILSKRYIFNSSFRVLTRGGCRLELGGMMSAAYTASHNGVIFDLHNSLERLRIKAEEKGTRGPVILITGPTDVGKSTLTRSLLNYAARDGRKPYFIDLDVGQSSISIPGTISILPIEKPADLDGGFDENKLAVYFFGHKGPAFNILLYFLMINRLGETLRCHLNNRNVSSSGAIIDTCGWTNGDGYNSILVASRAFNVDMVIVLAETKLYASIKRDLPRNIQIKFMDKLDGVVKRSQSVRGKRRDSLIKEYFYGTPNYPFRPYRIDVKFSEIQIFQAYSSQTDISIDRLDESRRYLSVSSVPISEELSGQILALSFADETEDILLTCVRGFVCVLNVDIENKVISLLSPKPSPLPSNNFIMGGIMFNAEA